ncbi:MAG: flavodoxin family protein [Dehalococcoidia bacterium]|nr:flavodoxin family protein [Dehalococcoidia bacterium]
MKVLGIVCSPRKKGNTEVLVKEALDSARSLGAETEVVRVSDISITPCDGCGSCLTTAKCKIKDDMQGVYARLLASDGIIFGSPVYFWDVTAQAKIIIDRTYAFRRERLLRNKVAGAVIVGRTAGLSSAFTTFNNFFNLQRMIPARSIGPRTAEELAGERGGLAIAYANKRGDVSKDNKAMAEARALGRAVVETITALGKRPAKPLKNI